STPAPSAASAPAPAGRSASAPPEPAGHEPPDEFVDEADIDLDELEDAPDPLEQQTTLVTEAFPGSEVIDLGGQG
ncbi:MAG: hypothetical protein D6683_07300, partial [Actinomyces sp.]